MNAKKHRACLSVPASNPRMQQKAVELPADQILFDLEDATAPSEKAAARGIVIESLRTYDYTAEGRTISVRVNGVDTPWCYRDVVEVVEAVGDRLDSVILPKAERPADVEFIDRLLWQIETSRGWSPGRIGLEVLIESASGLDRVDQIAGAAGRLQALLFGPGDMSASLGLGQLTIGGLEGQYQGDLWHYAQMRMLVAARANGLLALDGPYAVIGDQDGLLRSARRAAALGYDGKWVIHPSQIEPVTQAFSPDPASLRRAQGILDAYRQATDSQGRGAVRFEGEMIDEANRKMAEAVVARARWLGLA
jgi:citrate lyase subunit beta/citryl-CoA lyase